MKNTVEVNQANFTNLVKTNMYFVGAFVTNYELACPRG
jgi:uncharacterized protein (UPF0179 family)